MSIFVHDLLNGILGEPRKHNESNQQAAYDCPVCSAADGLPAGEGDGKGNLETNYGEGLFNCWKCGYEENMHGSIIKLVRRFGSKDDVKNFLLLNPYEYDFSGDTETKKIIEETIFKLPEEYCRLDEPSNSNAYGKALQYLKGRNIDMDIITKYNIGYCPTGKYGGRIIIPSYNSNGEVTYFIARSYHDYPKIKYLNPEEDKTKIIFNEQLINWDSTIYLLEGAFDHVVVHNSIPMLGKETYELLSQHLFRKANGYIVIVLDADAWENAKQLYKMLNFGRLRDRIRVVDLRNSKEDLLTLAGNKDGDKNDPLFGKFKGQIKEYSVKREKEAPDIAKIHELGNSNVVVEFLRRAHKLKESQL